VKDVKEAGLVSGLYTIEVFADAGRKQTRQAMGV
jgi:hypothetical protein